MEPPPRPKRNVAGIQPACHRASPRIAADPCGSRLIARGFISCFRFPFAGVVGGSNADFTLAHGIKRFFTESLVEMREHTAMRQGGNSRPRLEACALKSILLNLRWNYSVQDQS